MNRLKGSRFSGNSAGFQRHAAGFTLLEVLLTVFLTMVLLGGLWASIEYLFEDFRGGAGSGRTTQLLRGIQQQLNDDLQGLSVRIPVLHSPYEQRDEASTPSVDQVPSVGFSAAKDVSALPIYALSGTETSLRLLVLRKRCTSIPAKRRFWRRIWQSET